MNMRMKNRRTAASVFVIGMFSLSAGGSPILRLTSVPGLTARTDLLRFLDGARSVRPGNWSFKLSQPVGRVAVSSYRLPLERQ